MQQHYLCYPWCGCNQSCIGQTCFSEGNRKRSGTVALLQYLKNSQRMSTVKESKLRKSKHKTSWGRSHLDHFMHVHYVDAMWTAWLPCVCHLGPSIPQSSFPAAKNRSHHPGIAHSALPCIGHRHVMGEVHLSDSVCKPDISWMLCGYVSTRVTKYSVFRIVDVLFQFVSWFLFLLSQNRIYRIEQRQVQNLEDERRSPQMAVSSVHQDVCLCGSFGLQAEKGYHNFLRLCRLRLRPATSQLQHRYSNRPLGSHNHLHWTFPYRARSQDMYLGVLEELAAWAQVLRSCVIQAAARWFGLIRSFGSAILWAHCDKKPPWLE